MASAAAVLAAGLLAGSATAAGAAASTPAAGAAASTPAASAAASTPAARHLTPAGVQLPALVSQTPEAWTPNVYAGSNPCDSQWFGGSGKRSCHSTVRSTAVVNGEVVVAGAFTEACQPGRSADGHCTPGTLVTRDDIFAYQLGTGTIDPDFAPVLDQGPVYSVIAGPGNTVYVGGDFTTVNGASSDGVAQLNVTPGQPSTDGQAVSGFTSPLQGSVRSLAYDGNALYVGGSFTIPLGGRAKQKDIARLNATTGADDTSFSFALGDPIGGTTLEVEPMSLTADGSTLAIGGTFQTVDGQSTPRVALIDTGGALGAAATLANWSAPILANACSAEHDYVRALDFSPDGSFLVIATTGYESAGGPSVCDATARFPAAATGDVQPSWINYTGGDSFYAVAVTGSVVYVAGHNRFVNNECGDNAVCEANAVLVNGVAALDAHTGLALPWWHPNTLRGAGVTSLTPFTGSFDGADGGLLLGTDVDSIGGSYHSQEALFPLTSTTVQTPGGPIPSGMFSQGRLGGTDESDTGTAAMCVTDAGDASAPGTAVELSTCANDAAQNWVVEPGGTIQVNGMCLDTSGEKTSSGTLTVLNPCTANAATQVWTQEPGNTLVNKASGMCLDDPGASTTDPTQLQIYPCDGDIQQVWPLPVAQAPPPPPPVGQVSSAQDQNDSQIPCLNDQGDTATAGAEVDLKTCTGAPSENWTVESDGTIRINGLCLDTTDEAVTQGTLTVLGTCNGSTTQIWQPGADYALVNQASGMCLDDPGFDAANGTQLQIYSCDQGINQQWRLPAV